MPIVSPKSPRGAAIYGPCAENHAFMRLNAICPDRPVHSAAATGETRTVKQSPYVDG
jgi:hypothetical protein